MEAVVNFSDPARPNIVYCTLIKFSGEPNKMVSIRPSISSIEDVCIVFYEEEARLVAKKILEMLGE